VVELIASIFILVLRINFLGAFLGAGTMLGAIFSHIFVLGIDVQNDGEILFALAIITLFCCLILMYNQKNKIPDLLLLKI
jgi:hypothetical protein